MDAADRLKLLRNWPALPRDDKDAYFRSFFTGSNAPIEIPDAYRKCMEKCTNLHMQKLERCEDLDGQAAFECAQKVEEDMMHCYDGCNVMI